MAMLICRAKPTRCFVQNTKAAVLLGKDLLKAAEGSQVAATSTRPNQSG